MKNWVKLCVEIGSKKALERLDKFFCSESQTLKKKHHCWDFDHFWKKESNFKIFVKKCKQKKTKNSKTQKTRKNFVTIFFVWGFDNWTKICENFWFISIKFWLARFSKGRKSVRFSLFWSYLLSLRWFYFY